MKKSLAHMDQDFGRAVTWRGEQNLPGAYLHFSRDPKVASLERKKKRKTAVEEFNPSACCLLSSSPDRRGCSHSPNNQKKASANCQAEINAPLSIEDEWPTFLVRYSHLIPPPTTTPPPRPSSSSSSPPAPTDYTWQRRDEGRRPAAWPRSGETNT